GSDTLIRGEEFATNPCVNLISATTPRWISNNLSETMVGGGFTSRTIFIYEDRVRRRQIFYESLDHSVLDRLKGELIEDLNHIMLDLAGDFELDSQAKDLVEEWYKINADKNEHEDYRLQGYYERKPAHAFKLSMLLHIAYSDDLIITAKDWKEALGVLSKIEKNMPQVFSSVGKNPYTSETEAILDFIELRGKVTRKEVLTRFYHSAPTVEILLGMVNALVAMEKIKITSVGDYTSWDYNGKSTGQEP
ncbi:MAG TPA: DUF3987 domain-containing protein, partial [Methylomirabilota bacterium]|nr:DUF3987 domain-containing protein [Methylomirabilota bacterium]